MSLFYVIAIFAMLGGALQNCALINFQRSWDALSWNFWRGFSLILSGGFALGVLHLTVRPFDFSKEMSAAVALGLSSRHRSSAVSQVEGDPVRGFLLLVAYGVIFGIGYTILGRCTRSVDPLFVGYLWEYAIALFGGILCVGRGYLFASEKGPFILTEISAECVGFPQSTYRMLSNSSFDGTECYGFSSWTGQRGWSDRVRAAGYRCAL